MVYYSTFGVQTAGIGAWIDTFLVDTRFVQITVSTDNTFRLTSRRYAHVVRHARAYSLAVHLATLTVRSTW